MFSYSFLATCFRLLGVQKDHIEAAGHIILLWCICPTELGPIKKMIKFHFYPATSRSKDHSMGRIIVCVAPIYSEYWQMSCFFDLPYTYLPSQLVKSVSNPLTCIFVLFLLAFGGLVQFCALVFNATSMHKGYSNYSASTLFAVKLLALGVPLWHFPWESGERCPRQHNERELRTQWALSMLRPDRVIRQSQWDQQRTVWMSAFLC